MTKLFVWDFHGVLERGNEFAVLEIANLSLKVLDYEERFIKEDIFKLYGSRLVEYFRFKLPSGTSEEYLKLCDTFVEIARRDNTPIFTTYIQPNDYSYEVLEGIAKRGHTQIIISNATLEDLKTFLDSVNIVRYFPEGTYFGTEDYKLNGATKIDVLRGFLKEKKFNKLVFIGDSPQDVGLKEEFGGVSYLYAHPGRKFKDCEADYRISDLREILKELWRYFGRNKLFKLIYKQKFKLKFYNIMILRYKTIKIIKNF